MEGRYRPPISEEQKADFLDLIANGYARPAAAAAVDGSARQFRALCNPQSPFYDPNFAKRYEGLTEAGGEQHQAVVERVKDAFIERAVDGSDRAAEKVLAAMDPEFSFLRPQSFKGAINIETLVQIVPGASTETLKRMLAEVEAQEALPPGVDQVIDAA